MSRKYSGMTPKQIRDELECSVQEAKTLFVTSNLLDGVEAAVTVQELRKALSEFITMQTGVK